jgi:hypothetical protein
VFGSPKSHLSVLGSVRIVASFVRRFIPYWRRNGAWMASNKHHYIPKCYLKPWTGADGELCEYQYLNERVVAKRRHPSATGWSPNLYSVYSLPEEHVDIIEKQIFGRIDQDAANALESLIAEKPLRAGREINGWSRFIMSLLFRNPDGLSEIKREVQARWGEMEWSEEMQREDPESYADWLQGEKSFHHGDLFVTAVKNVCDMAKIGQILNDMHKGTLQIRRPGFRFMTSDNPLFVSGGLGAPDAHIMLPLSPTKLYIAATDKAVTNQIVQRSDPQFITTFINNHVVSRAHKFAYGLCENHKPFVGELWPVPRQI